jgi:hypothetical protein
MNSFGHNLNTRARVDKMVGLYFGLEKIGVKVKRKFYSEHWRRLSFYASRILPSHDQALLWRCDLQTPGQSGYPFLNRTHRCAQQVDLTAVEPEILPLYIGPRIACAPWIPSCI